ncbi:hypothetical protein HPP92_006973 [Vanilla planifolia]|uniref:Uncharacterized protein n=1 Tax=Vanilla planifolia TaxID=51239 RepID=A0A835RKW6_VANPL|nr:hypothetical protein HPP92_006973 [Vanilla planifolia]
MAPKMKYRVPINFHFSIPARNPLPSISDSDVLFSHPSAESFCRRGVRRVRAWRKRGSLWLLELGLTANNSAKRRRGRKPAFQRILDARGGVGFPMRNSNQFLEEE